MAKRWAPIRAIYNELIASKYKDQSFWVLCSFTLAFVVARLTVHYFPRYFLHVHGTHVHHFAYGIVILAVSGYLAVTRNGRAPTWLAIMFGIGLGFAVDETGMWLRLTNHYYNDTSEDAIVLVTALLINGVYFRDFWHRLITWSFKHDH